MKLFEIPEELKDYIEIEDTSKFNEDRYYMSDDLKHLYNTIISNCKLTKRIHELGFNYINTTLLFGLPGTGKTYFAKYISHKQDIPLVYVSFAKMMGGYGAANRIISDIFRFVVNKECVFMLDEIDCIARKRSKEATDTALTMAGTTITIMQELDYLRSHEVDSIIIGATNRRDTLDEALLSRFALKYEMQPLSNLDKYKFLSNALDDAGIPYDPDQIEEYCNRNSRLEQRNMELDMIQGITRWIENGEKGYMFIEHIK